MEVYDFISETNLSQAISQMSIVLKTATDFFSVSKIPRMVFLQRDICMESLTCDLRAPLLSLAMIIYLSRTLMQILRHGVQIYK